MRLSTLYATSQIGIVHFQGKANLFSSSVLQVLTFGLSHCLILVVGHYNVCEKARQICLTVA